jgi:surface protein
MDKKKESIILSIILLCLILISVGMSYAFLKTSFFGAKTSVLKVGSLSLVLDETSGNAITVEDGTPMYDSEGVKQDNYFTFALKNNGVIDSAYTIYLEDQPLDDGDIRVGQSYVHYNLEKDSSVLPAKALEGDQAIDKGIIKKNQTINYKMRLWFANDIPQSEENKVFKAKLNIVGSQNTRMMATNNYDGTLWNKKQSTVTKIVFQDSINKIEGESESWDISSAKNKTVMARLVPNTDDTTTNTLYIQGNGGVTANYDSNHLFYQFRKLTEIENINLLDTSNVTNMWYMFRECSSLTSLDVSKFDTSNVTNMSSMFSECNSLTNLDVSNFNTSKIKNMGYMFSGCSRLTSLDVSNFNTSKVTSMYDMFEDCSGLTSLDVSNFNTSQVTSMNSMFSGCKGLTSLDVSKFDTSQVTDMNAMFSGCNSLTSLDVSIFDTSQVKNMRSMFRSCTNLTNLDVSNFDTSQVTDMNAMFSGCNSLTSLDVSNFDTSNVTIMNSMFSYCNNLAILNLGNFNTSQVTNMDNMFLYCQRLTSLDFRKATFDKVTSYTDMFNGTSSTINIITKDATTKSWLEDKLGGSGTVVIA